MKKHIMAAVRIVKRLLKSRFFRARYRFAMAYTKCEIQHDGVLIQSYDGKGLLGNPYYILKELCSNPAYSHLKIYVAAARGYTGAIKESLEKINAEDVHIVEVFSAEYCKLLTSCKYLVNNATFASFFIKREGQIYLNTWHGTPLKNMGRNIIDAPNELGNTQRNMFMADYLLYPNDFTLTHMKEDYMLSEFFKGKYVLGPYPRNGAFYNKESGVEIRRELELEDKKVIAYMPTWRGTLDKKGNERQYVYLTYYLCELDKMLDDSTLFYVKAHNYFSSKLPFRSFEHIRPFPEDYETYEFLNIADCLVTDYSSVLFDFANTGKKIVLFAYDREEYLSDRGMYLAIDDLPFPVVENVQGLYSEIADVQHYALYDDFRRTYCAYDGINGAKDICSLVFAGKTVPGIKLIDGGSFANDKENVLIMPGALMKNGLTTACMGIINNIDLSKRNYTLLFYRNAVNKNKYIINTFPKEISYIPIQGPKVMTYNEAIAQFLYYRLKINWPCVKKFIAPIYQREARRLFPGMHFDYALHYTGYEKNTVHLFGQMDAEKIIFVHSDMVQEYKRRSNFHMDSMVTAYRTFDKIVPIRSGLDKIIVENFPGVDANKVVVAHNINDIDGIIKKAEMELSFDKNTFCNVSLGRLNEIINNEENMIFINIARYSVEKGLDRLVEAFEEFSSGRPDAYLIIIGGHGNEFEKIREIAGDGEKRIIIIRSISNPFPILKKSSVFFLSSHHEGLPMTIMEALILGIPVISTDIEGPAEFLGKGYGCLVEDSEAGIEKGMNDFADGKLKAEKEFNAQQFNDMAISEFESLFN